MRKLGTLPHLLLFCIFFIFSVRSHCQSSKYFAKAILEDQNNDVNKIFFDISIMSDIITHKSNFERLLENKKLEGFAFANIDSVTQSLDTLVFHYFLGQRFRIELLLDSLSEVAYPYTIRQNNLDSTYISKICKTIITKYGDEGYPFVKTELKYQYKDSSTIILNLNVIRGNFIKWYKIRYSDSLSVKSSFIEQLIGIKSGDAYRHSLFNSIDNRFKNLSFLKLSANPHLEFNEVTADLILPLTKKNASRFDFIIGVLPTTSNGRREWNVNGELYCDFINKLGVGERFQMTLKRLNLEDQFLKLGTNLPFILGTNFGFDGDLEVRRNKNLTLDVTANTGIQYFIDSKSKLKAYWGYALSSLININEKELISTARLPKSLDFKTNGGGIEFVYSNLDYIFNPKKGIAAKVNMGVGRRQVIKNNQILSLASENLNFSKAYDSIRLLNINYTSEIELQAYKSIGNWGVLKLSSNLALKHNNDRLNNNELYRIGGNRLLRGFDELSLFTNLYLVNSLELRLILDQNSFLSLPFLDQAWIRDDSGRGIWATGVGMGMNFETRAGLFNISFAAGNYNGKGFDFANTKIHFGYLSLF